MSKTKMFTRYISVILFGAVLLLVGCGEKATERNARILSGVERLRSVAVELKANLTVDKEAEIGVLGGQLGKHWATFEDKVKEKFPEFYVKVEMSLNPAVAGADADTLDIPLMKQLDDQLIQTLDDLKQVASKD